MPEFAPPDQLMYVRGDSLFAQTLDLSAMTVVGEPRLVAQPIFVTPVGRAGFVASNAGVLVTATGAGLVGAGTTASRSLTWFDRTGQEENVGAPIRSYVYPRISPDGTHVALDTRDAEEDIWIWSFARKTLSRLTFGAAYDRSPVWAFDSRRIIFASGDGAFQNLFTIGADATGPPERLTDGRSAQAPTAVTPDGRHVVFYETGGAYDSVGARSQLNILELGGTRPSQVLGPFPGLNRNGTVSPDGRWLAYESNESGRFEIYVRPYPSVQGGRWQVSTESGVRPLWSRDGRELFYVTDRNELMSVRVAPGTTWAGGLPERLFTNSNFTVSGLTGVTYDVAPDGRFLLVKLVNPDGAAEQPVQLLVVQNWFEELKLVPTN